MMNVSGHLLSTAELESALVSHPAIAEAAVVAAPHDLKGQTPYCFITLKNVSLLLLIRKNLHFYVIIGHGI